MIGEEAGAQTPQLDAAGQEGGLRGPDQDANVGSTLALCLKLSHRWGLQW